MDVLVFVLVFGLGVRECPCSFPCSFVEYVGVLVLLIFRTALCGHLGVAKMSPFQLRIQ